MCNLLKLKTTGLIGASHHIAEANWSELLYCRVSIGYLPREVIWSHTLEIFLKEKGGCCVLEMPSQQFSLKEEKRTDSFHEAVQVMSWFPAGPLSSLDS